MSRFGKIHLALATALLLTACAPRIEEPDPAGDPTPADDRGRALVVGDIDKNDPVRKFEWLKPFVDHLAADLDELGIFAGDVRIAPDMETMSSWLAGGQVDLYLDSLYPAMIVCSRSGAVPILRRWKGGVAEYHSVLLTTADSGVASVDDLPGRMLAFDDEASTSGFFLPLAHLRSRGLELTRYESADAVPPADRIGYVFTGDDENTIHWLLSGRVAAAAVDDITLSRDVSREARERFIVLAETDPVPRQVLVARADLDPELLATLTRRLLRLHTTTAGRAALASIDTSRFDEFPGGAEAALERLDPAYQAVREWLHR